MTTAEIPCMPLLNKECHLLLGRVPAGCTSGRSKRKRTWRQERPDVLVQMDKMTSMVTRRFHLPKPCVSTPMVFDSCGYVILFTAEHEIIRVNPPGRVDTDD